MARIFKRNLLRAGKLLIGVEEHGPLIVSAVTYCHAKPIDAPPN